MWEGEGREGEGESRKERREGGGRRRRGRGGGETKKRYKKKGGLGVKVGINNIKIYWFIIIDLFAFVHIFINFL